MNQESPLGGVVGLILGVGVGIFVANISESEIIGFITFIIFAWSGFNSYRTNSKSKNNPFKQTEYHSEQMVKILYTNSKGNRKSLFVSQNQVTIDGSRVIIKRTNVGKIALEKSQIINPEVIGLPPLQKEFNQIDNTTRSPEPTKNFKQTMEPSQSIIGDEWGEKLLYTRNDGNYGVIFFDPTSVRFSENQVIIRPQGTNEQFTLPQDKILNPEILNQQAKVPTAPMPEEAAPVLEPADIIVGDMLGTELLYDRKDGTRGVIYFDPDSLEITDTRVIVSPYGTDERYAILKEKIVNTEVLSLHKPDTNDNDQVEQPGHGADDEPPPILEPLGLIVGDRKGRELLYTRSNGENGVIYFDPDSLEITDTRAVVSPYGTNEEYAILLEKILNPWALTSEPEVPVIHPPEPVSTDVLSTPTEARQFETGVRVIIAELPADTYEAAQIMRSLKPKLGPFELLEALKFEHETLLQGYEEPIAKDIKKDLEMAGCTVSLQSVDESGATSSVLAPKVEIKTSRDSEPNGPWKPRRPQEHEFERIRYADGSDVDKIKSFIEKNRLNIDARDESGQPLIFGVRDPKIMGALIDMGADIHAIHHGNLIHIAASGSSSPQVMEMLIQLGVDFDAEDSTGRTPLIFAAEHGEYEMAKILVKHGANIHHVHPLFDQTALQAAQINKNKHDKSINQAGCEKIITLLREHGAS